MLLSAVASAVLVVVYAADRASSQRTDPQPPPEAPALKSITGGPDLGRPEATCAALIAITKSQVWWALAQDERRELFEETSHHIAIRLEYLPAIARRLYHGRDLGESFDFLTWFGYASQDAAAFEDLVSRLPTLRSGSSSNERSTFASAVTSRHN